MTLTTGRSSAASKSPVPPSSPPSAPPRVPPILRMGSAPRRPVRQVAARLGRMLRQSLSATPGRLRLCSALAVVACILYGLAAAQTFRSENDSLSRAESSAEQLLRVQALHTDLVRADAAAADGLLASGSGLAADQERYTSSISDAARQVAEAAHAGPDDGAQLAQLNSELFGYTKLVDSALAVTTNGAGSPSLADRAQALTVASQTLRTDALPILDSLATANQHRTEAAFDATAESRYWVGIMGVLALLTLLGVMTWVARRSHRLVNTPLLAAAGLVVITSVVAVTLVSSVARRVDTIHRHAYVVTTATSDARVHAFDARSSERLTLVTRASAPKNDPAWNAASAAVTADATRIDTLVGRGGTLAATWAAYVKAHEALPALDPSTAAGRSTASRSAADTSAGSANATFAAFDSASSVLLSTQAFRLEAGLSQSHLGLELLAVAALLLGLLAAGLSWWGVAIRLDEYR